MGKNCGTYPVIFLNFQGSLEKDDLSSFKTYILSAIQEAYHAHENIVEQLSILVEQNMIEKSDLDKFLSYLHGDFKADYSASLTFLIDILYDCYGGRKVWVLIDEYDNVLNQIIDEDRFNECLGFYRRILQNALKDNYKVEKAVITGILKYVKGGLFSGLNNFIEYDVLTDTVFHRDFGFTESEVEDLVSKVLVNIDSDQKTEFMEKLKIWYNGYIINGVTIYNPWSIMNCLFRAQSNFKADPIQAYWINTANTSALQSLFGELKKLNLYYELVDKKSMSFTPIEFETAKFGSDEEIFWTMVLHAGYLTQVIGAKNTFRIPNIEIQIFHYTYYWKMVAK